MEKEYSILLYYCYAQIDDHEAYREEHHLFCIENNLRGRVIISPEGLNGTVSGKKADCEAYIAYVQSDARFADTEFKVEESETQAFAKLHVRVKPEIVHSSLRHINPRERTGTYVEPEEFKELLKQPDEDTIFLDVRSNYEHSVGRFKNAMTLDIDNFREFPERVKELDHLKNKKVVTYCTGGIKCEKASAYLLDQGFENVYQLHGGIIKYGIETGGEDFEGKCYVFDNRITADVNSVNPSIVSKCHITGVPTDRMVNCANPQCNAHIAMSEEAGWLMDGCCSDECRENSARRPYDGTGYYQKNTNHYNPRKNVKREAAKID
ncbi:MAG: rhodanese-related sulfurtransferase [Roseivirga sp.]|nr:rhodanese-related sulfurtransferase [Roseivirga sp.]